MKKIHPRGNRLASNPPDFSASAFPDFEISHHGTLSLFYPLSDRAHDWLRRHCPANGEHQYFGKALVIENRFVEGIVCFAILDGLVQTPASNRKG
jgi:hypothetical protein